MESAFQVQILNNTVFQRTQIHLGKSMNQQTRLDSFTLVRHQIKENYNSEFKPSFFVFLLFCSVMPSNSQILTIKKKLKKKVKFKVMFRLSRYVA